MQYLDVSNVDTIKKRKTFSKALKISFNGYGVVLGKIHQLTDPIQRDKISTLFRQIISYIFSGFAPCI